MKCSLGIPAAAAAKSLQSCPTLCDPIDGSPPGSPIPGILQALISLKKSLVFPILLFSSISLHCSLRKAFLSLLARWNSALKRVYRSFSCLGLADASRTGSDGKESAAMWEIQFQSLGWEDPLKKGMATPSSILDWKIPWTEGLGGLQSIGSQK